MDSSVPPPRYEKSGDQGFSPRSPPTLTGFRPGDVPAPPTRWGLHTIAHRVGLDSLSPGLHPVKVKPLRGGCVCRKGHEKNGPLLRGLQGLRRGVVLQTIPSQDSIHELCTAAAHVFSVIVLQIYIGVLLFERRPRLTPYPRVRDKAPSR